MASRSPSENRIAPAESGRFTSRQDRSLASSNSKTLCRKSSLCESSRESAIQISSTTTQDCWMVRSFFPTPICSGSRMLIGMLPSEVDGGLIESHPTTQRQFCSCVFGDTKGLKHAKLHQSITTRRVSEGSVPCREIPH